MLLKVITQLLKMVDSILDVATTSFLMFKIKKSSSILSQILVLVICIVENDRFVVTIETIRVSRKYNYFIYKLVGSRFFGPQ